MEENQDKNWVSNETQESNNLQDKQAKIFSKEYFKYRFSKEYVQTGFSRMWQKYFMFFVIIAVVLIMDLVLKSIFDQTTHEIIKGFISINGFAHNTGAGFSIFSGATTALLVFSIICVVAYFSFEYLTMNNHRGYTYYVATSLMVAGTIGNMVDRLCFGYVRDFISFDFIDFPIFNIADCALTIGVILLAIWILFLERKEANNAKN